MKHYTKPGSVTARPITANPVEQDVFSGKIILQSEVLIDSGTAKQCNPCWFEPLTRLRRYVVPFAVNPYQGLKPVVERL